VRTVLAWLRQAAAHSPAVLVGLGVGYVGRTWSAIAWFAASRLAYVVYVAVSLRAATRARESGVGRSDAAWARFRRVSSILMDNDAIAFGALCIVTRGADILPGPPWIEVAAGAALFALGVGVKLWANATLPPGSYHWRSFFDPSAASGELTNAGPYRWLRHPMYTVGYAHAYGFALALGSIEGLFAAAGAQAAILLLNAVVERPHLRRRHGPR